MLIGEADPRVTGHAGVAAVAELDRVLGISSALDDAVGSIKTRRRGCPLVDCCCRWRLRT